MMLYESAPDLRCDVDHLYWSHDENLLGVTEVMVAVGLEVDDWFTSTDSSRGRAIHAVLAGAARGLTFDWAQLDPDLHGWVRSGLDYLKYLLADGAVILGVEVMRYHAQYRLAGTVDLVVLWRGYEWVLDWKSGVAPKVARFKLGAYDTILGPALRTPEKPRKKACIEVYKDGSRAHLVEYNGVEFFHDANRFLSYLTTARDMRAFGPKRKIST